MAANSGTISRDVLVNYPGFDYNLYRQAKSRNYDSINTFSTTAQPRIMTKDDMIQAIAADANIDLLVRLIISKKNIGLDIDALNVKDKVSSTMKAWINMGKFDADKSFLSSRHMADYYNSEFVQEFADIILPTEEINVKSMINPNGLYAQQTRTLSFKSKPPPFWERALYKRLEDRVRDIPIDETEDLFYKYEISGKKIPERTKIGDSFEREEFQYRMK